MSLINSNQKQSYSKQFQKFMFSNTHTKEYAFSYNVRTKDNFQNNVNNSFSHANKIFLSANIKYYVTTRTCFYPKTILIFVD